MVNIKSDFKIKRKMYMKVQFTLTSISVVQNVKMIFEN
ncbi:hypothetical protein T11_18421 [Trichinella zimbabwensis]|uniref:Uncharacterized protein n=1 Tax=Trichinella zimbabwensis TaxID=268475 RepID=A0A0V1GCH8_9BILA|nr:hypothetical protein T11_18421 [Trichinella zimbabwensis]